MFLARPRLRVETARMILRPPAHSDFRAWTALRQDSAEFLQKWEPTWAADHLTRKGYANRVYWAQRSISSGSALPHLPELHQIFSCLAQSAGLSLRTAWGHSAKSSWNRLSSLGCIQWR